LWGQLASTATRPPDDEPEPRRPKEKEKTDSGGMFRLAGRAIIIKRMARTAAGCLQCAADAFTYAAKAMTAPELPDWLREFFEIEADPDNPLDLSNPDRDLVLGASDGVAFEAGYDITGPSLDL
jgi:hypothetical protein